MKKLINPFIYLSGGVTLAWGAVGVVAMTFAAWYLGSTFRGVLSQGIGSLSLWQLALQQIAGWGVFASLLWAAARIFSKSKIRAVDIYGNQGLARLPLLLVLLGSALPAVHRITEQLSSVTPDQLAADPGMLGSGMIVLTIYGFISLGILVWFFVWSFLGFSVAANLKGWHAGIPYIACYLLAEVVASWCTATIGRW